MRSKPAREADRRFLRGGQLGFHAGTRVDEQRERDREVRAVEKGDVLFDAVFEHAEIIALEIGEVVRRAVGHRDVERHELDAGAERRTLAGLLDRLSGRRRLSFRRLRRRGGDDLDCRRHRRSGKQDGGGLEGSHGRPRSC